MENQKKIKQESCKCGANDFNVKEIIKRKKAKYYRVCRNCGKEYKDNLKRAAYAYYFFLCQDEALKQMVINNIEDMNVVFKIQRQFKKKYRYIYENLHRLFRYQYKYNVQRKMETPFSVTEFMAIMKKYQNPLSEQDCIIIMEELEFLTSNRTKSD